MACVGNVDDALGRIRNSFRQFYRKRGSERLIPTSEQSGLQTRIATTETVFVVHADELLAAFVELESAIRACGEFN